MNSIFFSNVVVSKGYNGAPALKYSEKGDSVRFRIGQKIYDSHAENNTRWMNITVKAFGKTCERIGKMKLKEGSYISLVGRLDEDTWEDAATHEKKSAYVIIADNVEYCFSGDKKDSDSANANNPHQNYGAPAPAGYYAASAPTPAPTPDYGYGAPAPVQQGDNFVGYEPFGGGESFFNQ